jgi:Domain of unknown function (DUF397)
MLIKDSFRWRKSSFSGGENADCIEVGLRWRKSSFSGGENNACIELAGTHGAIRDSKNPTGPILRVDLQSLLGVIREGWFDS